jgi:hypothetical protein
MEKILLASSVEAAWTRLKDRVGTPQLKSKQGKR